MESVLKKRRNSVQHHIQNQQDFKVAKDDCHSKGKTPDGTVFKVPHTREMVQSLLDVNEKKSFFDFLTLAILLFEISLLFILPRHIAKYFFLFLFLFWRLSYNLGLGILLKYQSDKRGLVKLAKQYHVFDQDVHPKATKWLKQQLGLKMNSDYQFDTVPVEYNTWLLFRQLVDLILMNDFGAYVCFAISWLNTSPKSSFFMDDELRWIGGIFLIVFNIWVKLDAQRVVKDFAWYWGDFFFLIEQSLTFDGVFEMAPHPMYSVGYIGYYGISLICASYTVLFISIIAHALQMAFLVYVETPHIDKIYNPPTVPKRQPIAAETLDDDATTIIKSFLTNGQFHTVNYFRRDLIVFKNFDLFRSSDLASAFIMVYGIVTPFLVRGRKLGIAYAVTQAVFWRLFHSAGLGWLLYAQSENKLLTRHFVKWGGGVDEAFQNWKSIYNFSSCMTYVSFITLCLKFYTLPDDWTYGMTLLRHTLGLIFIGLHIWTSVSIYEVLGDFGWFYGDFFVDDYPTQLLYTGIYRYLNNPEKIMGHAAFWGFSLITNNRFIFTMALFSQIANSLFLHFVEKPHMEKLYGDEIRKEAGLTKTLRTAAQNIPNTLPSSIRNEIAKVVREQAEANNNRNLGLSDKVNGVVLEKEKSTSLVDHLIMDTIEKIEKVLGETGNTIKGRISRAEYITTSLEVAQSIERREGDGSVTALRNNKEGYKLTLSHYRNKAVADDKFTQADNVFTTGERIKVNWFAPATHGPKDWIGVYRTTANTSTQTTSVGSQGRWVWTNAKKSIKNTEIATAIPTTSSSDDDEAGIQEDDGDILFPPQVELLTQGTALFKGSKLLPWKIGTYEFRYHHDGNHKVMAVSIPFEIVAPPTPNIQDENAIQLCLLRLVQNALDNNPEKMPMSPIDNYTYLDEPSAKKVAYVIKLVFGIEFAWEVIVADTRVSRLSKRIQRALAALSPFSNQVRKRSSLASISSTSAFLSSSNGHNGSIAHPTDTQPHQQTDKRASFETYDIYNSHGESSVEGFMFGSSPNKHSPLHKP